MKKYLILFFLSLILVFQHSAVQAQCAMCRSSLESNVSTGEVAVSAKLNLGIIYLFVTPYLLFSLMAFFWYRTSRKNGKSFNPAKYFKS